MLVNKEAASHAEQGVGVETCVGWVEFVRGVELWIVGRDHN